MNILFKRSILLAILVMLALQLAGCGETLQGIGKDVRRVGQGVKTIFVRDSE